MSTVIDESDTNSNSLYTGDRTGSTAINALYSREIEHIELPSYEEVLSLAKRIERGRSAAENPKHPCHQELIEDGERARHQLIKSFLRLVVSIAKRYKSSGIDLMDLVQEGNVGLIHAVEKFDYRKGYTFGTYATWWIRQAITRALFEQTRIIRVPLHKIEAAHKVTRAMRRLEQSLGQEPTLESLAQQLDISQEQVTNLLLITQKTLSLEARSTVGNDELPLGDLLEDDERYTPESVLEAKTLKAQINDLLDSSLIPRERRVLQLRFGLDEYKEYTLLETGQKLGLSYEAVRQLEAKALEKLASSPAKHQLSAYLHH